MQDVRSVSDVPTLVHSAYLAFVDICRQYDRSVSSFGPCVSSGNLLEQSRAGDLTTVGCDDPGIRTAAVDLVAHQSGCACRCSVGRFDTQTCDVSARVDGGRDVGSSEQRESEIVDEGSLGVGGRPPGDGGSTGGSGVVAAESGVSLKTLRNRDKRQKARSRKRARRHGRDSSSVDLPVLGDVCGDGPVVPEWRRGAASGASTGASPAHARYVAGVVNRADDGALADSVRRKWMLKNELEAVKIERQLAVFKATGVEDETKRYRTGLVVAAERNMVNIEKAHAQLRSSGNSTDDDDSRVETLLTDGSTAKSISPDSSASQAEVRQMQKDLFDAKAREEALTGYLKKMGIDTDLVPYYHKATWTVDSNGEFGDKYEEILNRLYPGGFVDGNDSIHGDDGKVRHQVIGMPADDYYD